ncbi:MAG TPA: WYL domain-containing transcriptional regulator [Candidatus Kryptonia bacterium]
MTARTDLNASRTKTARQIEMLALVEKNPGTNSVADLCDLFHVEVATLNRDLRELREMGFDIHSIKGKLILLNDLVEKDYRVLLASYLGSVGGIISFPKNISLTVKQLKGKTLGIFTSLVAAIGSSEKIEISYVRHQDSQLMKYTLEPYDIIPGNRDWRLIAMSNGIFKQFIVGGITSITQTGETFKRSPEYSANDYYAGSFGFFSGKNVFEVVLEFDKRVSRIISSRTWSEDQEITPHKNGGVTLKMKVNSIEEVGSWVLSWGGDVIVVKPKELKKYVTDKAAGILARNKRR